MNLPEKFSKLSTRCDEHVSINYAKIVILGDKGVGKTAIVKVIISRFRFSWIFLSSSAALDPEITILA